MQLSKAFSQRAKGEMRKYLIDTALWNAYQGRKNTALLKSWVSSGRPVPPPHIVKQRIVEGYAKEFHVNTLIETGTYLGDMVYAMRHKFNKIISIELSNDLSVAARVRFRNYSHIDILSGDSAVLLPVQVDKLSGPCLFWLDGHYSGGITAKSSTETPILTELNSIFAHRLKNHVILIDDASCFDGSHDYPTLQELQEIITTRSPCYHLSVKDDVIRLHPPIGR